LTWRKPGWWCDANLVRLRRSLEKISYALPSDRFTDADWHGLLDGYNVSSGAGVLKPTTPATPEGPPGWKGIYDDEGRLMVAANYNMDMGDAWEHADDPGYPLPMTAFAYQLGVNYVIYALTH
jgi:hypothetical protein